METLINGYRKFLKNADRDIYKKLANGQKPHTFVISCSDSRIIPEEIFSAGPGELFVLRNVGNVAKLNDPAIVSAIEYALLHLEVRNVVILSHSDCGAVKALAIREEVDSDGLREWFRDEEYKGHEIEEAVKFHGQRQYERFLEMPVVRDVQKKRELNIDLFYFEIPSLQLEIFTGDKWQKYV